MLTVAPSPNTSRPSFFDLTGRAKWDAWMQEAQTYEGRPSEAEHRYLDIARSLGWKEGSSAVTLAPAPAAADETGRQDGGGGGGGGGAGMGFSVSVISPPTLNDLGDSSELHQYAIKDDVSALSAFLSANEGADINVRDEYVSFIYYAPCHSLRATGGVISVTRRVVSLSSFTRTGIHCAPPGCRSGKRCRGRVSTQARRR